MYTSTKSIRLLADFGYKMAIFKWLEKSQEIPKNSSIFSNPEIISIETQQFSILLNEIGDVKTVLLFEF